MKCIICEKKIKRLHKGEEPPELGMWGNGGVHEFIPGYGSKHDMSRFIIGICDDCLDKLIEKGIIKDEGIYTL